MTLFALSCVAFAAPVDDEHAEVLKYENENIGVDGFRYAYETSNGISEAAEGQLNNVGTENEAISVRGHFTFVGADGVTYTVNYVADENGFQPEGDHIPK
ncbi:PREDICTED: flexible cuticle protein 12-like [Nicrophorus vespilloides]|uniref:Flexible cuticle protein 12-like n=1 Tax=Nicrophorus vespilloides TaxID=110193 RepID=A0ABM1N8G0_NICVS|nr:PREDICTED: flexible cuticle protein 12-like [Nicrophorus vespilloides]